MPIRARRMVYYLAHRRGMQTPNVFVCSFFLGKSGCDECCSFSPLKALKNAARVERTLSEPE